MSKRISFHKRFFFVFLLFNDLVTIYLKLALPHMYSKLDFEWVEMNLCSSRNEMYEQVLSIEDF